MSSKEFYQIRINECEKEIRENDIIIEELEEKIVSLKEYKKQEEQDMTDKKISFSNLLDAKSKGILTLAEQLNEHVQTSKQMAILSDFDEIQSRIENKIDSIKEQNMELENEILSCKASIAQIEKEEEEKQSSL